VPFEELLSQLEDDLGGSIDEFFSEVEKQPLAAASIAQVHKAILKNGTPVILKIRRPGLRKTIEADLRLLHRIVDIAESESPEFRRFHPKKSSVNLTNHYVVNSISPVSVEMQNG